MTKAALRKTYSDMRAQLGEGERNTAETNMLQRFQELDLPKLKVLMSYVPIVKKNEIDLSSFTKFLKKKFPFLILALPITDIVSITMTAFEVNTETIYSVNKWGIKEPDTRLPIDPTTIDVVFVPLLCFDTRGFRVGYGKGFYDRFLVNCRPDILKVGFSYFPPVDKIEDVGEWDLPLNYVITPDEVYVFK